MGLDAYIKKIDKYLAKAEGLPLIVDVQNERDQKDLILHYHVGSTLLLSASDYCARDKMPRLEELLQDLTSKDATMIVSGVTSFLKLQGKEELRQFLRQLLVTWIPGHVIFFTFQCKEYLPITDSRLGRRIVVVDGESKEAADFVLVAPEIPLPGGSEAVMGIHNFPRAAEEGASGKIYVVTEKTKSAFPESMYSLSGVENAYQALAAKDPVTTTLPQSLGTDTQWNSALKLFENKASWADVVDGEFGSRSMLEYGISNYQAFSEDRRWLYFIALKLYGSERNWCLATAAKRACDKDDLILQVYRCLLEKPVKDKDFWDCYASRKAVLREMGSSGAELTSYCKVVFSKGIDAIYYLTDSTQKEQEAIFAYLDQYGEMWERNKLIAIMEKVYPALYQHLSPYRFGSDLLDQYFQDYKHQKVINKVLPWFEAKVGEQAQKREYNYVLQPRSAVLEKLDRKNSQLYFMDAMGVEYLGFILATCKELGLNAKVSVCAANLPSITSRNKEFVELFSDSGHPVVSVKELDDIKHHGKYDYDFYKNSKLPIHLSKELEVIRSVLTKIRGDLTEEKIQRAFMISDHGSSRLAVLHDTENLWEMGERGLHSGRCCPKTDVDEKPELAADAGDFWALANYDRFKGSRKANVEVHGGATLEELCVPVIELTCRGERPEVILMPVDKTASGNGHAPEIQVSFRKKAAVKIFVSANVQDVGILVNGTCYPATECGSNFYQAEMPELKKQGTYYADVYAGDNLIAEKLPFTVKKEGQQEKDLL